METKLFWKNNACLYKLLLAKVFFLRFRITSWENVHFYLTTLPNEPIEGGLVITVPFDNTGYQDNAGWEPRLLAWCTGNASMMYCDRLCYG